MAGWASTGIDGLDAVLTGLEKGDNVVWQVDRIENFAAFVDPYVERAKQQGRRLVYMRFADHQPLVKSSAGVRIYNLDAGSGFEAFTTQVHEIIADEGKEAYYVFDCLSYLLDAWATDLMIGNFFMVTCPYLFELNTIAYFTLLRNRHSFKTIARIRETTQLLLDLYNIEGKNCLHPLKVWKRYSPTMFLPHLQQEEKFEPITSSVDATKLLSYISERGLKPAERELDYWDKLFLQATELSYLPDASQQVRQEMVERLCKIMIGRDERMLSLATKQFTLEDLCAVKSRLIGTGFIGGKAVGMQLANKIIAKDELDLSRHLEPHDSFYVGSDVFYTYLVENDCWKLRVEQKTKEGYFKVADQLREKLLQGKFPDQIREQFQEMIEYFGQSPIIVRSSSLLEDAFGNAFAGKYESVFCVNQGDPEQRYADFVEAVRTVYASTMNENALMYRLERGLDQKDEQMALLVQRVSGSYRNGYFFPDLAGVGMSHNAFVWNADLDPKAGMLRLVFGLGTRAVNRVEDDYPRIIALDEPLVRPLYGMDDVRKYSQHNVDLLDTQKNAFRTIPFQQLLAEKPDVRLELVAVRDYQLARQARQEGRGNTEYWLLTFEKLLTETSFTQIMQNILKVLESHYQYPVDIEFTVNFTRDQKPLINLLQCRPLQTRGQQGQVDIPEQTDPDTILFSCEGHFMGGSICQDIKKVIYVDPKAYIDLTLSEKYDIARLVGGLNRQITTKDAEPTILFGPGRWGTTTPSLGVPVSFHEINKFAILAEIAYEGGNLMPELSFGTHFFQDLVEGDIFYVALFPGKPGTVFSRAKLDKIPNRLTEILPESGKYADVVGLYEMRDRKLRIISDITSRKVICFFV
ncbi:MAG: phosphoenolpyruvate synthase [Planctomycetes bacterium RBG_19FT_COMBO_48_8]|nr:MAG: phosphoenolpyruvate synthase [Planctomycetes bacterium RBG_19FT_COMBO_48_8]